MRLFVLKYVVNFFVICSLFCVLSCSSSKNADVHKLDDANKKNLETENDLSTSYKIGSGDKLRITVFNEEELSGEFEVDSSGTLSLPLIGTVNVDGLSVQDISSNLVKKYSNGYLKDPKVNLEVLNYRPFFIIGEVNSPGSYPYVSGITLVNAVALAGGYTYRAKKNGIIITRDKKIIKVDDDSVVVFPGDSILVKQRLF